MQAYVCDCGKICALEREFCPHCGKLMTSLEISNDAEILTYTIEHIVPDGFNAPIFLVLVKLEQGAILLCECENEKDLEIGRQGKIVCKHDKYYFIGCK